MCTLWRSRLHGDIYYPPAHTLLYPSRRTRKLSMFVHVRSHFHVRSFHIHHSHHNYVHTPHCVPLLQNLIPYRSLRSMWSLCRYRSPDEFCHQWTHMLLYPSRKQSRCLYSHVRSHLHVRSLRTHRFHYNYVRSPHCHLRLPCLLSYRRYCRMWSLCRFS